MRGQFRGIDSGAGAPTLAEQFGVSVDDIFVDITPFGWDALQSIHRPQNNIIASTLAITGERAAREVAEKELATLDLMGANFRSDTACLVTNIQRQYRTTEFIGESFTGTGSSFRARDFREGLILETADGGTVLAECLVSNTNTPSSLIQQQVDRALAEPLERTKIPTEFQQIIASSFSNLVNTFVNRGIQAATSRMSPAQPSSTRGPLSPLENLLNDISAEEAQNNQDDWSGSSFIVIDLLAELDGVPLLDPITGAPTGQFVRPGAITLAEQELALINQMLEEINTTFVALQSLDRCIPGPDFGWESRLRNSLQNKARMRRASNSNANRNQAAVAQVEFAVEMLIPVIQREMRGSATESTFVFGTTIPSADIFMQEIDQTANVRNLNTRLETERGRVSETLVALRTMRQKYTDPSTTEAEKSNIRYGFTQLTTTPSPQAVAQRQNMLEGMRAMQQSIAEKQLRCEAEVAQKRKAILLGADCTSIVLTALKMEMKMTNSSALLFLFKTHTKDGKQKVLLSSWPVLLEVSW
ncbi:MAG: hypothetical protein LRY42_00140 [Candidatus Pacebacteria bacterium]|nr:hypothetical protein [Candidatus Paceibacterota bacterium]